MRKIRHSTFETNSSSTHALVLPTYEIVRDQTISDKSVLITDNFFDNFEFKTNDPVDKINFIYSCIKYRMNNDKNIMDTLFKAIHLQCPNLEIKYGVFDGNPFDRGEYPYEVLKDVDTLADFLFCSKAYLYEGEDHYLYERIYNDLNFQWQII